MKNRILLIFLLVLVALSAFIYLNNSDEVGNRDPWTPLAPPNAPMAGYLTIANTGDNDINLVGASSADFGMVMIHRSVMEDGVMKMHHVDEVPIAGGESVHLEPGGLHLMLMKRKREFSKGETIVVLLSFSDKTEREVRLTVTDSMDSHK